MNRIDNSGKGIAGLGRGGDTRLAHVMTGEMVVPPVISPQTQEIIKKEMIAAGINPEEYTVGEGMSINPITGLPEFGLGKFLKKSVKSLKKVVKKVAPIAAIALPVMGIGGIGPLKGILGGGASSAGAGAKFFGSGGKFRAGLKGLFPGAGKSSSFNLFPGKGASTGFNIGRTILGQGNTPGFIKKIEDTAKGIGSGIDDNKGTLALMALAAKYGEAVKSDYEKKQGGLQDIRTSIRPDLVPQQTFQGFDMGIRKAAMGGLQEIDMRMGGPSVGPGTGTSDDIPAMLSDGEFVMTSAANNGLGGFKITKTETGLEIMPSGKPNRQKGAKNMDKLMKVFENYNDIGKA